MASPIYLDLPDPSAIFEERYPDRSRNGRPFDWERRGRVYEEPVPVDELVERIDKLLSDLYLEHVRGIARDRS